ncbi:MAG: VanZ family protein [Acutalibacteraceae bacterium]|nr:VanZ family protein [Acutalibacteraceae bacterium]
MTAFCKGCKIIKAFRIITAVLLCLWMMLIFSFSSQNADASSQTSGSVIETVADIFYPEFSDLSEEKQIEIISALQFIVRKAAHFTLYAILGVLSFLSVVSYRNLKYSYRLLISSGICLLYAMSDEFHQLFVAGRSGEIRDVFIDFCGSLLAITVLALFSRYSKRIYDNIRTVN